MRSICFLFVVFGILNPSLASEILAKNCEIFVDRAQPLYGGHYSENIVLWIKLNPQVVKSGVDYVRAYRRLVPTSEALDFCKFNGSDSGCEELTRGWFATDIIPFFESKDYYETSIFISSNYRFARTYESYFVVKTKSGSVYRTFTEQSDHFILDRKVVETLRSIMGWAPMTISQEKALTTSTSLSYFNPLLCK